MAELEATSYRRHDITTNMEWPNDCDELAELAGRACYQSWGRPNPETATNEGYLKHILQVGHESVLEHASATFYVTGVSRSLLAEITRHRHLSFSVLSQRYVDESHPTYVTPPAIFNASPEVQRKLTQLFAAACGPATGDFYKKIADELVNSTGCTRKQAREAARSVLPNATETKFVVTGNMRAWRDVLKKRMAPAADAEMQQFAQAVYNHLKELAPNTFQDFGVF